MRRATLGILAAVAIAGSDPAFGQQPQDRRAAQAPAAPAEEPAEPPLVEVQTYLNQTAVWVGDPIEWTVDLICAPTVDVIADDLAGEKLSLTGLELVSSETMRTTGADGRLTHRTTYRFGGYEIGQPQLKVEPFKVRYYEKRAGQRAEDVAPAGEAAVPGATIAWRSTLPNVLDNLQLRDLRGAQHPPSLLAWARPVGLTLVVMSAAPVLLWAIGRIREMRRPRERRPSARTSRKEARAALAALSAAETGTADERLAAYTQLREVIRRYVADTTGLAAGALTPEEMATRANGKSSHALTALGDVLAECDRARYGRPEQVPSAERFRDSVTMVERLVQ